MVNDKSAIEYSKAIEDFRNARAKARLQHLWASVTGKSDELLQYDEITKKMHIKGLSSKGVKEIPIEAIVGSVNRYQDFDKNFLPLRDEDMQRWARVKTVMTSPGSPGLPPISVYKLGDAYFVLDGNHRVSIAKQMDLEKIEAHITEIKTKVALSPEDTPEEIILKSEYSDFLESTNIDEIIPGVEMKLTFPGQYSTLEEHINVHRHYLGIEQEREIPWKEAVLSWYENVYHPIIEIIREQNILTEFPRLTETDLYIWILDHQTYMEDELGWSIRPEKAVADLVEEKDRRFVGILRRGLYNILHFLLPMQLEIDSKIGESKNNKNVEAGNLFKDILVATNGREESWIALEQGIIFAELEGAEVRGLIVEKNNGQEYLNYDDMMRVFNERLHQSRLRGNLVFTSGKVAETILDRAQFNDLVILKLMHPPKTKIFSRLKSGLRTIIRKSEGPILLVKNQVSAMNHLLVAYDGSEKSEEALFIGKYLGNKYKTHLSLLVVSDSNEWGNQLLTHAKEYLGDICISSFLHGTYQGVSQAILKVAAEKGADMILMGGYGLPPLFEIFFGSTVDEVLRGTKIPVIICQ